MKRIFALSIYSLHFFLTCILCSMYEQPRGPFVISQEVNNDKTVVFRYLASQAKAVRLSGQMSQSTGKAARFSGDGGRALNIGLTYSNEFASVCSFAPYTATGEFKKNFSNWSPNTLAMNKQLKLFLISGGTEDFRYESVQQHIAPFKDKNLKLETLIIPRRS